MLAVAVVEPLLPVEARLVLQLRPEMVAMEQHQAFQARLLLMLVAVEGIEMPNRPTPVVLEAQAAAVTAGARTTVLLALLVLQTPVAVAAAQKTLPMLAAPAS